MMVSLSPGPALALSNLVSGSISAGAAPLAWPAISESLLCSDRAELRSFVSHAAKVAHTIPKQPSCFLNLTRGLRPALI